MIEIKKNKETWPKTKLGEIVQIIAGQAPPSSSYNKNKKGVSFLRVTEFGEKTPSPVYWTSKPLKICEKNDVLLSVAGTIGNVNISDKRYSITRSIFALRIKNGKIIHPYLFYYLKTLKRLLEFYSSGSAQKIVTIKTIYNLEIPIPPLLIQKKIVSILNKAMELRENRRIAINLCTQLIQSYFKQIFGDPLSNPKNFPTKKIKDITIKTKYGTSVRCISDKTDFPVLRIPNVLKGKVKIEGMKYTTNHEEFSKHKLEAGDILFVRTNGNKNYVGRCAVFEEKHDMAFASYLIKLKTSDEILPHFLITLLQTNSGRKEILSKVRTTAGQYNINAENLKSIKIICPPKNLQEKFVKIKKQIDSLLEKLTDHLEKNTELYYSLQEQIFQKELVR